MLPHINLNNAYPKGILAGFNAQGRVVVCMEWLARVEFVFGTEDDRKDVLEWHMNADQDRRARWIMTWAMNGFPCVAVPQ